MYRPRVPGEMTQRRSLGCLLGLLLGVFQGKAGPSPSPQVIVIDSSGESDMSDVPWAPLEPEPLAEPRVLEADEVTDMPVGTQGATPEIVGPLQPQDKPPQRSTPGAQPLASTSSPSTASFPGLRDSRAPVQGQPQGATSQQQTQWHEPAQPHAGHQGAPLYQGALPHQGHPTAGANVESIAAYRIGYAPTYDPAADPWHEDGMFPGVSAAMRAFMTGQPQVQVPSTAQHVPTGQPHDFPYDPWEDELDQPSQVPTMQPQSTMPQAAYAYQAGGPPHGQLPPQGVSQAMPGAGHFDPPTMDPWGSLARHYASSGPLLPPEQWGPNVLGLQGGRPAQPASPSLSEATTCAGEQAQQDCEAEDLENNENNADTRGELPEGHPQTNDEGHETDTEQPDNQDDLDWESDTSDGGDDEEEDEEPEQTMPKPGKSAPKRAAGHGSQRLANKAKKSDVKKRWRELNWGKKPNWLSWRGALPYIQRGEKPPMKQPLPPTPSPQREYLASLLSAHHYSYDAQGNIVPHHPPRPHPQQPASTATATRGEKASNQAKEDHAQRRATNLYMQPTPSSRSSRTTPTATSSATGRAAGQEDQPAHPPAKHRREPQQQQQEGRETRGRPRQPVQFQLPEDHRENPPRPVRRQDAWRKLTGSTTVQLTGDGVHNYPVQIVDNRPAQAQTRLTPEALARQGGLNNHGDFDNQRHNIKGDVLVVQPLHLTEDGYSGSSSSSASRPVPPRDPATTTQSGGPPILDMEDLDLQAAEAIDAGHTPAWQIEGDGPSMRSSVRVDDNNHDLSWVQGATPRTLPPPMPLHPRTVISMRGSATGSWRGVTWSPPSNSVVLHPPRRHVEPTLVIYKTLASQQNREVIPDGVAFTIYPAGAWIATTRFELGFARTPRYWLLTVEQAPPPTTGRVPLRQGDSFWLEWRGQERVWQRRPRFANDVQTLGGFAIVPGPEPPRPPTPPQRHDPTVPKASSSYQGALTPDASWTPDL